ncbi:cell wall-binding protein [hydrocarbon metagenome]|uniref:Cell wall-binding protein n=1 Tax=hydrocarbon metagenome TaxID=938273 RepID=A0A0W8E963_9ZZZZ
MKIAQDKKGISLKTAVMSVIALLLLVSLFYALQKPVAIDVDGDIIETRAFFTSTVEEVLENRNVALGPYDKVQPSLNSIVKRSESIKITRASPVTVIVGGVKKEIITTPVSITEAINLAGFDLGPKDIIKTLAVDKTIADQVIEVIRVTEKQDQIEETIPYETEKTTDNTLEKGLSRTIKSGQPGIAVNTVNITYHNGQEVARKVIDSETKVAPEKAVVAMGTITAISRGNLNFNFDRAAYMTVSAYTYTGRNTSCGLKPAVGLVAVDPNVIPLGSKLYIEGYGYATAADTGGSIKGDRIDVFMEDRGQCLSWGRKTVKVYILN